MTSETHVSPPRSALEAWQLFTEEGTIAETVRKPIAESWRRCKEAGVDPNLEALPKIGPERFEAHKKRRAEFIKLMSRPIEELGEYLSTSNLMICLCDTDGCLLVSAGDPSTLGLGKHLGLVEGVILHEEVAGANCIGMALATEKAASCAASEHYCRSLHSLGGSAAPAFDLNANLLGALGIFGAAGAVHPERLMALATTTVKIVRRQMRATKNREWLERYRHVISTLSKTSTEAMVIVGPQGYIRQTNPAAIKLLGGTTLVKDLDNPVDKIARFTPPLFESFCTGEEVRNVDVRGRTPTQVFSAQVDGIPLFDLSGELLGTMIIFRKKKFLGLGGFNRGKSARFTFRDIIGESETILKAKESAMRAAPTHVNVLLEGSSGTGKEMFAQAIHNASDRSNGPFVAVNCAAIPPDLIESELFGYREGAFTGARKGGMIGKFEAADGGTIFLDEVGDMPLNVQSELLRVLENKSIGRIGESIERPIDIRVIAATNKKLLEEVEIYKFREDLYYRLSVTKIILPALQDWANDIPLLVERFIKHFNEQMGRNVKSISEDVLGKLVKYSWPGNVRELKNAIENAVMMSGGDTIVWGHLPSELEDILLYNLPSAPARPSPLRTVEQADKIVVIRDGQIEQMGTHKELLDQNGAYREIYQPKNHESNSVLAKLSKDLEDNSRELYTRALELNNGSVTAAAKSLGIGRATFYRRLARFGVKLRQNSTKK